MPQTLANLQADALSRLNEYSNSPAGNLEAGTGGAATIATAATLTQYLNEAAADIARTAFPIVSSGSFSWPSGAQSSILANFTMAGGVIFAARGVVWNGAAMTHCSRSALENYFPTWAADAPGTPLYWYDTGQDGIGLYPIPSATQTATVSGFAVPAAMVNPGDIPSWLPDDKAKLLAIYAAAMIAQKNLEDPTLAGRAEVWRGEYERGKADLLARLTVVDPLQARLLGTLPGKGK